MSAKTTMPAKHASDYVPSAAGLRAAERARKAVDALEAAEHIANMSKQTAKTANFGKDYPLVTLGSRVAARGRAKANKMTEDQAAEYYRQAMVRIYGGQPQQASVTGH